MISSKANSMGGLMWRRAKVALVVWIAFVPMLPGCAYFHPVAPLRADATQKSDGIRRNVEIGSIVRLKTRSGQEVSGEVESVTEVLLVLRVHKGGAMEETRPFAIDDIEDLEVKTWRRADTIFFTSLAVVFAFTAVLAVYISLNGGFSGFS